MGYTNAPDDASLSALRVPRRLGIDLDAEISNSGVDAYRIARRKADELLHSLAHAGRRYPRTAAHGAKAAIFLHYPERRKRVRFRPSGGLPDRVMAVKVAAAA